MFDSEFTTDLPERQAASKPLMAIAGDFHLPSACEALLDAEGVFFGYGKTVPVAQLDRAMLNDVVALVDDLRDKFPAALRAFEAEIEQRFLVLNGATSLFGGEVAA